MSNYTIRKTWQIIKKRKPTEKWISWVNWELEMEWYKPASSKDVIATYMTLIGLDEPRLKELEKDELQPMLVKIICKWLLSKNSGAFDILEKVLDRWIGKPVQRQENLNKELIITIKDYEWWEHNSITA